MPQIAVIDDAPLTLRVTRLVLDRIPGAVTYGFTSSSEALAWSERNDADCFIVDYRMPAPDGLAVTRALRERPRTALVPIIMVTGTEDRGLRYEARDAGVTDFIEKPADPRDLVARVNNLLALHEARKQLALRVGDLSDQLREEQQRTREHVRRLEALWKLSNDVDLPDDVMLATVLSDSAAALRPGESFNTGFVRVDGDHVVVEAIDDKSGLIAAVEPPGTQLRLADTMLGDLLERNSIVYWNDLTLDPRYGSMPRLQQYKTRSLILAPVVVGRETHAIWYASQEPTKRAFAEDDLSYVLIAAAFIQSRIQRRRHSEQLRYQSEHDVLTGSLNRSRFRSLARTACIESENPAVAVVNLIGFRQINQNYGTITGDALLVEVAAALHRAERDGAFVGRLAGDEFGICLPSVAPSQLEERLEPYLAVFDAPFSTGDRDGHERISLGARIGAAAASGGGEAFGSLLRRADLALQLARGEGRGGVTIFEPAMETEHERQARLTAEIRHGLEAGEFVLFVQPHLDLRTGAVTGGEALIRWQHPVRKLLTPKDFIPFAERVGLIGDIDRWVAREALLLADALAEISPDFRLYFNVSPLETGNTGGIHRLPELLASARSDNVGVEITETSAMRDLETLGRVGRDLQRQGVRIAIDDFGTGYSSLAYLHRFPFDVIKIDGSFVRDAPGDTAGSAICETILSIGARFGKTVVAEGVETEEQLTWLRERGCDVAQGYVVARPLPFAGFTAWLRERSPLAPPR